MPALLKGIWNVSCDATRLAALVNVGSATWSRTSDRVALDVVSVGLEEPGFLAQFPEGSWASEQNPANDGFLEKMIIP